MHGLKIKDIKNIKIKDIKKSGPERAQSYLPLHPVSVLLCVFAVDFVFTCILIYFYLYFLSYSVLCERIAVLYSCLFFVGGREEDSTKRSLL